MATNDTDVGYNGWTNYETWSLNLWVINEEAYYRLWVRKRPFTVTEARKFALELFPEGTPDMDGAADLFKVDWDEIVENWNQE